MLKKYFAIFLCLIFVSSSTSLMAQSTRTPAEIDYQKDEKQSDYVKRVFPVGTRVVAMYPGSMFTSIGLVKAFTSKYRYLGTVSQVGPIKKDIISEIYVVYDDGDQSWVKISNLYAYVPLSSVSNTKDYVGKSVMARYYDSGSDATMWDSSYSRDSKFWYVGTINKVDPSKGVYVVYKDGDTKWHKDLKTISVLPNKGPSILTIFQYYGIF